MAERRTNGERRDRGGRDAARAGRSADRGASAARRAPRSESGDGYHREDLRRELLDRGLALLAREGLAAFSMRELAQELGVSHAAPYRHFASREELLAEIVRESMSRFAQALGSSAFIDGDDEENLYRLGEAYVLFFLGNPEILALFSLLPGQLAERGGALGAMMKGESGLMEDGTFMMLRRAASAFQGKYPGLSERDVLMGFWAKAHGLACLLASNPNWFAPEDLESGLARVIRSSF